MKTAFKYLKIYGLIASVWLFCATYGYGQRDGAVYTDKHIAQLSDEELINLNLGWQLGLGFGVYFPGSEAAAYYDGTRNNNLRNRIINYSYNYNDIKEYFNHDFELETENLPQDMGYEPALNMHFFAQYFFNQNNGIVLDFSFARLKALDLFALTIDDPSNTTSEPTLEFGTIWGLEERVNINIGYMRFFGAPNRTKLFWEIGLNINDSKSKENKVEIGPFTYDIRDFQSTQYQMKEGGLGAGFFITQGVLFNINKDFALQLAGSYSMKRIALQEADEPLSQNWTLVMRIVYKNLFGNIPAETRPLP